MNFINCLTISLLVLFAQFTPESGCVSSRQMVANTLHAESGSLRFGKSNFAAKRSFGDSTIRDTLVAAQNSSVKKKSRVRRNGSFRPLTDFNPVSGIIAMGIGAVCSFVLGIGFISARMSILGEILYPAGFVFMALGLFYTVLFIVRLRRRAKAKMASGYVRAGK